MLFQRLQVTLIVIGSSIRVYETEDRKIKQMFNNIKTHRFDGSLAVLTTGFSVFSLVCIYNIVQYKQLEQVISVAGCVCCVTVRLVMAAHYHKKLI